MIEDGQIYQEKMNKTSKRAEQLLKDLNREYIKRHNRFEDLWWRFRMGDHSVAKLQTKAEKTREMFRSDPNNLYKVRKVLELPGLNKREQERLKIWEDFLKLYQIPKRLIPLRDKIAAFEGKVVKELATRKEGYIDPKTGRFVDASRGKMRMMMRTNPDESVRRSCFEALEKMSLGVVGDYARLVAMRNKFAKELGYEDFYAYKLHITEGMTKKEVFGIFDEIYRKTKFAFEDIRKLESRKPGLRKTWNFGYMMAGGFTLEEDPYYDFGDALLYWGRSFAALGISFKDGQLQLDLLDRKGKYDNGFCHYPRVVNFDMGKRNPGAANFTCNVIYGQPGSGFQGMHTLFHEGGHAADRLCSEQEDACLNTEWPPASIAWAETHSQFLDTMFASIEWRTRYAKNKKGESYPFELFERKTKKLRILAPLAISSIIMVSEFEKMAYEAINFTKNKAISLAREMHRKHVDHSNDSLWILSVPHIYDWENSAYYHSYGLAVLGLQQWREYFYKKYGYIVDNPKVGEEMSKVWELGSLKKFPEFIKLATGREISPKPFLDSVTMSTSRFLTQAKRRLEKMKKIPEFKKPVRLNAKIRMLHGKKVIADNSKSFEDMAKKYKKWLNSQKAKV